MSKVNFSNISYFGSKFNQKRRARSCTLMNLLLKGLINFDGTIDSSVALSDKIVLSDLWFYIWYLWKYNKNDIEVFQRMTSDTDPNAANADKFVMAVKSDRYMMSNGTNEILLSVNATNGWHVKKEELIAFINRIFMNYQSRIKLPELETLFVKLEVKLLEKERKLTNSLSQVEKKVDAGNGITISIITDGSRKMEQI